MRFRLPAAAFAVAFVSFTFALVPRAHAAPVDVPPSLRDWEGWALDGSQFVRCPYVSGFDASDPSGRACLWPGPLDLAAAADGARFRQQVRVYAEGWVELPGDAAHWPEDVRVDGAPSSVIDREGRPVVRLAPGSYDIAGTLAWTSRPEAVAVPPGIGIVRLSIDGARVPFIERDANSVRLGAAKREQQSNQFDARIYRKLSDTVPGKLTTRVMLQVSGEAREEFIGPLLPDGFTPVGLHTALPARLDPDGRLRVQVRPGAWTIELVARASSALSSVRLPAPPAGSSGDAAEVWSYEAVDRLRVTSIEGAVAVDPAQTNVPGDWQSLPGYRLEPGAELRIVERSRGFAAQDLNQINVTRDLWRDFDGAGYTFRDSVSGRMQQHWRLDMSAPYQLQGARAGEQALLVTQGREGRSGVEVRSTGLEFEGTGRVEGGSGAMPATGWETRLASLAITLTLPPGERLFAAFGVDESPTAWADRWRLLDIFVVLLVAAAAFRVAGWPVALLAAVALTLSHHELRALTWLFLNGLIAIALAEAAPAGRLRAWANTWRNIAFALILIAFVPFAFLQARMAFYPQIDGNLFVGARWDDRYMGERRAAPEEITVTSAAERMDAAAAAAIEGAADSARVVMSNDLEQKMGASAPSVASPPPAAPPPPRALPRYAPGTLLQSGPGVPSWSYGTHPMRWNGPVEPTQQIRLVVLDTWLVSLWRIVAIVLLALLCVALARRVYPSLRWPWLERWLRGAKPTTTTAALLVVACLLPPPAPAQVPTPELLEELRSRLTRAPECAPNCVSVSTARVTVDGATLVVRLEAHADARAVLALPGAAQRWSVDRVTVDGAAAPLSSDAARNLTTALEPGVHEVVLSGPVADTDAVRLAFPQRPARVTVAATGWEVSGVDQQRLIADSLTLSRSVQRAATGDEPRVQEEFPPFVRLHRRLSLDLDWSVTSTLERVAPEQGAFTLDLPLLPGESVLSAGLPVRDGHITISMPAGVPGVQWQSRLERKDTLKLAAPKEVSWIEVWQVAVAPIWHVDFKGTPEVFAATPEEPWTHEFQPRPGETLELSVVRPVAVEGATVAFEMLRQEVAVGQRSTDTTLAILYRSTQGGRHVVKLPAGARLQGVTADGQPLAIRDENGQLALPLQPGQHQYVLAWQHDGGAGLVTRPGAVELGAAASNVSTTVQLPQSRWVLFAMGGGVGPAILYWSELVVFVVVAVLLGRLRRTLLKTHEWLLVGLGLSTFSWSVLLLFAVWVFAIEWRRAWPAQVAPWRFNTVQVLLALLTVSALGSLVSAIPNGLLGTPDMRIDGARSSATSLAWFHDRIAGTLPQPMVFSVSIWFYKAAMLAWALWLSFALVRWVRWAWDSFTSQRLWSAREPVRKA